MKKILLLLVGAVVAFAAHAYQDVYLRGDWHNGWTADETSKMQTTDGVTYTLSNVSMESGQTFKIAGSDYNTVNYGLDGGSFKVGDSKTLEWNKGNLSAGEKLENVTFTFNLNTHVLSVTGSSSSSVTYQIKGDFTGNNWSLQPLPFEYTFDGTQGEQQFGFLGSDNQFYGNGNETFNGTKKSFTISQNGGNCKIAAYYKGTVRFSVEGTTATVEPVNGSQGETQTFTLYFYAPENANLSAAYAHVFGNSTDCETTWPGKQMTSTGKYVKVGDEYYPAWSVSFTGKTMPASVMFNGGNNNSKWTKDGGITFVNNGFYKYSNGSANEAGVTGLTLVDKGQVTPPIPVDGDYTVYFYAKESDNISNLKVYFWNGNSKPYEWAASPSMTSTGKYIYINGEYCPVWKYSLNWTMEPEKVIFSYNNAQTKDLTFANNGFYTISTGENVYPPVDLPLVDKKNDNVLTTIYMHWKEDYLKEAFQTYPPKVHIYSGSYDGNNGQGDHYLYTKESGDEEMYCVSEKYQIWAFDIPKDVWNRSNMNANNVHMTFYFYENGNSTPKREYNTNAVSEANGDITATHDAKNWDKFIYTTVNGGKAVQTYLSYEQFTTLDAQGRPYAYVLGAPAITTGNGTPLAWTPQAPLTITPEDGCFYFDVTPNFNYTGVGTDNAGKRQVGFKVGWINPGAAVEEAKSNGLYSENTYFGQRDWATYDLGIIGVNDLDSRISNKIDIQVEGQLAKFHTNTSVSYLNYNQYNWTLVEGTANTNQKYYVVIDTHSECRSVTLCTVDPHPNVTVKAGQMFTLNVDDPAAARAMHIEHLYGSDANGHIIMDEVNYANGEATIQAAGNDEWRNAGFTREYTLGINGQEIATTTRDAETMTIKYMPMSAATDGVTLRAKYTDNDTKITFHSRLRHTAISSVDEQFKAPEAKDFAGKLYFEGYDEEDPNVAIYGLHIPDFDIEINHELNKYADFDVEKTAADERAVERYNVELLHADSPIQQKYNDILAWDANDSWAAFTPCFDEDGDFDKTSNDWSGRLHKVREQTPVFIHDVVRVPKGTKTDVVASKLSSLTGKLYAVYPFIYDPTSQVEFGVANNAPAQNGIQTGTAPESYDNFLVTNARVATPFTVNVNGAISAVENIEADFGAESGEVEYFTISGVRVQGEPAPGIYIRRQGNQVSKVVIK